MAARRRCMSIKYKQGLIDPIHDESYNNVNLNENYGGLMTTKSSKMFIKHKDHGTRNSYISLFLSFLVKFKNAGYKN